MPYSPTIQVPSDHYREGYDSEGRWSSYWVQISAMLDLAGKGKALEVGVGNGVVAHYLRQIAGLDLTTVDIDPELAPDHIASITELPFGDREFAVVAACEVLEHLPYDATESALRELRRVADTAVISIPEVNRTGSISFRVSSRRKSIQFPIPSPSRRTSPLIAGEHYWELGMEGYDLARITDSMKSAGWRIDREFRHDANAWHHFFVLS